MTVVDEPVRLPPPDAEALRSWSSLLHDCQDGDWYMVRSYPSAGSASTVASELRRGLRTIPPGRWEFRVGPHGDRTGIWARRLDPDPAPDPFEGLVREVDGGA